MARSNRAYLLNLIDRFAPELSAAFRAGLQDTINGVDLSRFTKALQNGDVREAVEALNLNPAAFHDLDEAITRAYKSGGLATIAELPLAAVSRATGLGLVVRFNARNERAEAWLRERSSTLITGINDDLRVAVRSHLFDAMSRGDNPRVAALDIVGRINSVTGNREGGILGLTSPQERYLAAYRAELASTDSAMLRNALRRSLRDKRFDSTILKAINSGEGIPGSVAENMAARYTTAMLRSRGEVIGRTEALASLNASALEALQQTVDAGLVKEQWVKRIWRTAGDTRVRDEHEEMEGQSVGLNEPFTAPDGTPLMHPGDPSAPPELIINCRCIVQPDIDYLAAIGEEQDGEELRGREED